MRGADREVYGGASPRSGIVGPDRATGVVGVRRWVLVALWLVALAFAVWVAVGVWSVGDSAVSRRVGLPALGRHGLEGLPAGLQAVASSTLGAGDRRPAVRRGSGGDLVAAGGPVSATFGRFGPVVQAGGRGASLSLRVTAIGRATSLRALRAVSPVAQANRVMYRRIAVNEWYRNGPLGIEQGFTVTRRPAAGGAG